MSEKENDLKKMENRLTALEELLAHQSVMLEDMSAQLLAQSKYSTTLERQHKALLARVREVEDSHNGEDGAGGAGGGSALTDEKPPHY